MGLDSLSGPFLPGRFADRFPTTRAKDILYRLEGEGLITTTSGQTQRKYRLTDRGSGVSGEGSIGTASA